uniref:TRAP transporter large permease subunit n=1 Tax=uncultured Amphritea sp. TaxID=981605 RepID=UPI00262201EB
MPIATNPLAPTELPNIKLSLTGDVTGEGVYDGLKDVAIDVTVADDSHNHGAIASNAIDILANANAILDSVNALAAATDNIATNTGNIATLTPAVSANTAGIAQINQDLLSVPQAIYETGDRRDCITVTKSDNFFVGDPNALVDGTGNSSGVYFGTVAAAGKYLQFDFIDLSVFLSGFRFKQQFAIAHGIWELRGSKDGAWLDAGDLLLGNIALGAGAASEDFDFPMTNASYESFRLVGVSGTTSNSPFVYEVEFKGIHISTVKSVIDDLLNINQANIATDAAFYLSGPLDEYVYRQKQSAGPTRPEYDLPLMSTDKDGGVLIGAVGHPGISLYSLSSLNYFYPRTVSLFDGADDTLPVEYTDIHSGSGTHTIDASNDGGYLRLDTGATSASTAGIRAPKKGGVIAVSSTLWWSMSSFAITDQIMYGGWSDAARLNYVEWFGEDGDNWAVRTRIGDIDATTSETIASSGTKTFKVLAYHRFVQGQPITIADSASPETNYMTGTATTIAASGTLGQIIPPSIVLILLADAVSNANQAAAMRSGGGAGVVSVGDLFAGALIPGFLLVGLYLLYLVLTAIFRPEASPVVTIEEHAEPLSAAEIMRSLGAPLLLIIAVQGSILEGLAPPTEAAAGCAGGSHLRA